MIIKRLSYVTKSTPLPVTGGNSESETINALDDAVKIGIQIGFRDALEQINHELEEIGIQVAFQREEGETGFSSH